MGPEFWRVGQMDVKRVDKKIGTDKQSEMARANSGRWQVYVDVFSNINGLFKVLAFVEVGRDLQSHPATMGYYIKDFNSYRITQ